VEQEIASSGLLLEEMTPHLLAGRDRAKLREDRAGKLRLWLSVLCLLLVCALSVIRFWSLEADFPNWSPWMIDQAKFTDEGWWASGAVNHFLLGHWNVPGDYNPAAALPVWPCLLGMVFRFTGVSVTAARALNVALSIATMGLVFLLVRRFSAGKGRTPALLAVLVMASSPFAYAFSRLATLETLVIFEFCLTLLITSYLTAKRFWLVAAISVLIALMILTKTTAAILVPAVLWVAWRAMDGKRAPRVLAMVVLAALPAVCCKGYALLIAKLGYGADYQYFFDVNAMEEMDWGRAWTTLAGLFRDGFLVDRVLYPVALAVLLLSLFWRRKLWSNPLFAASWMAIAAQAFFIFTRGEDTAPRYFLAMLAPMTMVVVLALGEFMESSRRAAALLAMAVSASVVLNVVSTTRYATHRSYDFYHAAEAIGRIVRSDSRQKPMILGVSGSQISLMAGIASINDAYSLEDMDAKVASYKPGWYLAWKSAAEIGPKSVFSMGLEVVGSYRVFDDDDRNRLVLYRMVPLAADGGRKRQDGR
jgi:hypothetical protein